MGGLIADLDLLKALPCIVRCRINAVFVKDIFDFLMLAGGDHLFAVANLLAYCFEGLLIALLDATPCGLAL